MFTGWTGDLGELGGGGVCVWDKRHGIGEKQQQKTEIKFGIIKFFGHGWGGFRVGERGRGLYIINMLLCMW